MCLTHCFLTTNVFSLSLTLSLSLGGKTGGQSVDDDTAGRSGEQVPLRQPSHLRPIGHGRRPRPSPASPSGSSSGGGSSPVPPVFAADLASIEYGDPWQQPAPARLCPVPWCILSPCTAEPATLATRRRWSSVWRHRPADFSALLHGQADFLNEHQCAVLTS